MRGPFTYNTDWYYGPHSTVGTPNTLYALAVPSRVVKQTEIFQLDWPYVISQAWITLDNHEPNLPEFHSPSLWYLGADWLEADRVALEPFGSPDWFVMRKELVTPPTDPNYWRVLIGKVEDVETPPWPPPSSYPAPVPAPAICAPPGIVCVFAQLQRPYLSCGYTVTFPDEQWWRSGTGAGVPVNFAFTYVSGDILVEYYVGADCSSLSLVQTDISPVAQIITPGAGQFVFVRIQAWTSSSTYSWAWV